MCAPVFQRRRFKRALYLYVLVNMQQPQASVSVDADTNIRGRDFWDDDILDIVVLNTSESSEEENSLQPFRTFRLSADLDVLPAEGRKRGAFHLQPHPALLLDFVTFTWAC